MTKEEQAKLEADKKAKEEAEKAEAEAQEGESQENTEEEPEDSSSKVDYKALLLVEKERAEKAEKALATDRYKASKERHEKGEPSNEEPGDDEDKPITAKQLQQILARDRQESQKAFEESRAREIVGRHTTSEDEAEAALLYWKTRVVPTGNLEDDITFAIAGLNYRKAVAEKSELARALRGKDMASRDTATVYRDTPPGTTPKLSSGDAAAYKRAGFTYDNTSKVWKKKLPNGTFLIKDPKTKQTMHK